MAIDISKLNHEQLTALMARVHVRLGELQLEKVGKVRDRVMAMITSEGIDFAELMGKKGRGRPAKSATKGKAKQKYRNPADKNQTWSGRGRHPAWFDAAIKAGKTERSLLIK